MASTVVATLCPSSSRLLLSTPPRLPASPLCSSSSAASSSHRSRAAPLPKGRALASAAALLAAGAGLALAAASANALPLGASAVLREPENALSLPTWAVHVSSVIEWVTAMVLVWEYGEKSGFPSWKGLSWGMSESGNSVVLSTMTAACAEKICYLAVDYILNPFRNDAIAIWPKVMSCKTRNTATTLRKFAA
uniref:Uncharacterized protein n=1 Tax=Ananas comosus var. bracteatus TaxID=296719 RepID=A0A6V7NSQ9_ANACO|nr:unnamed protein product [Ananas comosus var. bracteatus]